MCGLADVHDSSGRAGGDNSRTLRPWRGSLIWLLSLPSEKGAGPALAELHVRFRVQLRSCRPQVSWCARAPLATFEHDRRGPSAPDQRKQYRTAPMPITTGRSVSPAGACATNW